MPPRPPISAPPRMAAPLSWPPAISRPASAPAPAPASVPSIGDTSPGGAPGYPGPPGWQPASRTSAATTAGCQGRVPEACPRRVLISLPHLEAVEVEDLDHRDAAGLGLVGLGEVGLLRLHDLDEGQPPVAVLVGPRELGRVVPAQLVRRQHVVVVGVQRGEPPGHLARQLGEADAAVAVDVREDERLPSLVRNDLPGRRGGGGRRPAGAGVLAAGKEPERSQREGRCRGTDRAVAAIPLGGFGQVAPPFGGPDSGPVVTRRRAGGPGGGPRRGRPGRPRPRRRRRARGGAGGSATGRRGRAGPAEPGRAPITCHGRHRHPTAPRRPGTRTGSPRRRRWCPCSGTWTTTRTP